MVLGAVWTVGDAGHEGALPALLEVPCTILLLERGRFWAFQANQVLMKFNSARNQIGRKNTRGYVVGSVKEKRSKRPKLLGTEGKPLAILTTSLPLSISKKPVMFQALRAPKNVAW